MVQEEGGGVPGWWYPACTPVLPVLPPPGYTLLYTTLTTLMLPVEYTPLVVQGSRRTSWARAGFPGAGQDTSRTARARSREEERRILRGEEAGIKDGIGH